MSLHVTDIKVDSLKADNGIEITDKLQLTDISADGKAYTLKPLEDETTVTILNRDGLKIRLKPDEDSTTYKFIMAADLAAALDDGGERDIRVGRETD